MVFFVLQVKIYQFFHGRFKYAYCKSYRNNIPGCFNESLLITALCY